jgi:NitT/TauT family transport system permease protein
MYVALPSSLIGDRTRARPNPRQEAAWRVKGVSSRRRWPTWARGATGIIALALVWELAPPLGLVNPYFLPPLHVALAALWAMVLDGELATNLGASLLRSLSGFALAIVTAIPLGAAIAWYRPVRELLTPVLEIFRNTAALAILPVITLILGIGETSKIAIVTYACFFPILLSTVTGVATVETQLLRSARVLGLSPLATFGKVVFPAALPTIFTGVRISGASAILVLIAAEMVGANSGLGYLISYAQNNFLIPKMYAGILTTSALGVTINYSLVAIERRLSRWRS